MSTVSDTKPLAGLRVVDFSQYLAGPMTAMFLADSGADVIRVDPPGGPRWEHPVNATVQRGKRCVELDLKTEEGRSEATRLIATADVVIEGFRPGVMARLGLDPVAFCSEFPRLIWGALPGFGHDDPRADVAAWEGVLCAATGMYRAGLHDAEPVPTFNPLTLASNFAAFLMAHRVAAALLARERSGAGAFIEVPLYDACFQAIGFHGEVPISRRIVDPLSYWLRSDLESCVAQDGNIVSFDSPTRGLQAFLNHYLPGYDLLVADDATLAEISKRLTALIKEKPAAEWERIGQEQFQAAMGVGLTVHGWLQDQHARDAKDVVVIDDPELGRVAQAGLPVRLSGSPLSVESARVFHDMDAAPIEWFAEAWELPAPTPDLNARLPLEGVKVVDFSTLLAGPNTSRILAQYGADVIKVDKPSVCLGEIKPLSDDLMAFVGHRTANAGKRMLFLDLSQAAGRQAIAGVLREADIVCHNFTPAAAQRLGVSAQQVRELNAAAVHVSVSLHSHGGSRETYRGHDPLGQMASGMCRLLGGSGEPQMAPVVVNDHATGHLAAFGVLLALLHRGRTGETQDVNCSLARTATLHLVPFMLDYEGAQGSDHRDPTLEAGPLNRLYRAQDDYFFLAHHGAGGREMLGRVPVLDGVGDVGEQALESWLGERFAAYTAAECVQMLTEAGLGAHRNVELMDTVTEEIALDRGLAAVIEHPGIGRALGVAHPMLGSSSHEGEFLASRRPGMDTLDILQEHGMGDRIVELLANHVAAIGENPVVITTTAPGYWASGSDSTKDVTATMSRPPTPEVVKRITESEPRAVYTSSGAG